VFRLWRRETQDIMSRILIVDDELGIRRTLGQSLRRDGYEVREAADATAALEQLNETEFDVVVTDINMPGVTGVELLRRIHATAPQVQVVMMTGEPTVESASESLRAGAADYLLKPITMVDLLRVVANAVKLKALHDGNRQLEAANRAYQENLERMVDERTGQLREIELRLDQAMSLAQLADWEYDVASGLFRFSDRCYEFVGTTAELEGGSVMSSEAFAWKFVHADDAHLVAEEAGKAVATADPDHRSQFEMRMIHRDGEVRHVLVHLATNKDALGQTVQLHGAVQDITERKKSEQELRKLWRAVEQSPATVVITNVSGNIEYVNPKFVEITGYTAAEALGQNPRVLKSGLHAPGFYKAMWDTLLQGNVWQGEIRNKKKNGDLYWESACISPVRDIKGKITHFIAVKEDIAERKRAENALRESEARMRAVTDSAQDAILMMDQNGHISYWNPAAERMLGYTSPEALGQKLHAFIVPSHYHAAHHAALPMFQQTGQGAAVGKTLDLEARRKDGMEISVQLSLSAFHMGGAWHAVGILRDVTAQKQAEAELQETNRHLEAATGRANAMAAQAEMASGAKSQFLANMSHEIRTPMNGVLGMIGLLLDTDLSTDQRRYAQTVRASGEALLALINDILDFSKIEARKLDLETLDFSLHNLLDDFAGLMSSRAHEKGLVLGCVGAPEVPSDLRGDPGRLRQILINLTGNAIKFTAQGEVIIRVSLVSETPSEVLLRFAVRDTGIGIPADKLGKLFTKFSQVDSSTTRTYGGTGLGLAISKQLAGLMGGEVGVQSEAGRGSEFWFTVCLAKAPTREPAAATTPADLRGIRVLVVDDHPVNREILLVLLKSWGLRPAEAADGPSAVQALTQAKADQDPFAIAVLDMQMPGMDGESLGRAIKADPDLRDTRLVMCGSLGQMGSNQRLEDLGFVAALTKPVRRSDLQEALAAAISGKNIAASRDNATAGLALGQGFRQGRILVAEDNITNQQVAVGILRNLGLRAEVAANGIEAIQALETIPYDLVLMDVQMPEMDGLTATRQIRDPQSAVRNHHIPIIAMTAHALQRDREKCLAAGMNDYVTKPVEVSALVAALEKWLPPIGEGRQTLAGETKESETAAAQGRIQLQFKGPPEQGGDSLSPQFQAQRAGDKLSPPLDATLTSAREEAPPVFDRAGLMNRMMNDEELARVVIAGFLGDLPGQIKQLKSYAAARDARHVGQQAHKLRGACATVGGEALRALAAVLEQAGEAGDVVTISSRVAELDAQFAALKEAMNNEI
jgi:PAS domain S-box-containing protein